MEQVESTVAVPATPVAAPAKAPAKAPVIRFLDAEGNVYKIFKYTMPLKAPRYKLIVNGVECEAAQTTWRDILYTYFVYKGCSLSAVGHHNADQEYTFEYPDNYDFTPMKVDRRAQAEAAAKANAAKKAAKAAAATVVAVEAAPALPNGEDPAPPEVAGSNPESTAEAAESAAPHTALGSDSDAPTAKAEAPKKGKKAQR